MPQSSDLDLSCDLHGVIDFDPWVANCTLSLAQTGNGVPDAGLDRGADLADQALQADRFDRRSSVRVPGIAASQGDER